MARKSMVSLQLELSRLNHELEHAESLMSKVFKGEPVKLGAQSVGDLDKTILKLRKQVDRVESRIHTIELARGKKEEARKR